jgi:hypothetical protein
LLKRIKDNDYDERIIKHIDLLIDYSILRRKSCELMIKLFEKNYSEISPEEVRQELIETNLHIENKLKELENLF